MTLSTSYLVKADGIVWMSSSKIKLKFDIVKVLKDRTFKRRWPWGHFFHEYNKRGLGSLPNEWVPVKKSELKLISHLLNICLPFCPLLIVLVFYLLL